MSDARVNQPYRPDVDGLRAVAILLVIGFHAFPNAIQGGFIGVDVFFVISGFLISTVIINGLETNKFSFLVFYQHRVRRIFPALSLVLISCAVAGWYLLSEGDIAQLGKHIAGGAGFVSNIVLWKEAGYFDSASDTKPLLHLWSLGIEEQFYFIWPLVLWFSWKRRWNILVVTAMVLLASFCANVVLARIDAVGNFYSPLTRIWELLIGAALVRPKSSSGESPNLPWKLADPLAIAGFAAIIVGELALTKARMFPGWWALLPTIGAASIIAAGPQAWINRKFLAHPGMVWVGLISYPLYLWHWPILAFLRITGALKSPLEIGVCAISAAFALSWLTYRLVERPFRSVRIDLPRNTSKVIRSGPNLKAAGLLVFMTFAAVLGATLYQTNGSIYRDRLKIASLPPLPDKSVFDALKIYEHYDNPNTSCRDKLNMTLLPEEVCVTNSSAPKVLFFGDSHAMGLYSAIFANHLDVPSVLIASPGCLVYPNLSYRPPGREWGQNCTDIAKKGLEYANRSSGINTIIISLVRKGDNPLSPTNFYSGETRLTEREVLDSGTSHLIGELLKSGKIVIYVVDVPYFHNTPENCQSKFLVAHADQCVFDRSEMNTPFKVYFDVLSEIKAKYPELKIVNAEDVLCTRDTCAQHDAKQYYYIDKDHLSVYGSESVLASLFARFPVN